MIFVHHNEWFFLPLTPWCFYSSTHLSSDFFIHRRSLILFPGFQHGQIDVSSYVVDLLILVLGIRKKVLAYTTSCSLVTIMTQCGDENQFHIWGSIQLAWYLLSDGASKRATDRFLLKGEECWVAKYWELLPYEKWHPISTCMARRIL
jgi:hypothetical protein